MAYAVVSIYTQVGVSAMPLLNLLRADTTWKNLTNKPQAEHRFDSEV